MLIPHQIYHRLLERHLPRVRKIVVHHFLLISFYYLHTYTSSNPTHLGTYYTSEQVYLLPLAILVELSSQGILSLAGRLRSLGMEGRGMVEGALAHS